MDPGTLAALILAVLGIILIIAAFVLDFLETGPPVVISLLLGIVCLVAAGLVMAYHLAGIHIQVRG